MLVLLTDFACHSCFIVKLLCLECFDPDCESIMNAIIVALGPCCAQPAPSASVEPSFVCFLLYNLYCLNLYYMGLFNFKN